jgi:hypothetical protein
MVISEVFRAPVPGAPPTGPVMLLEGLRAGIAGQLAVLDDVGLTGTWQSSADVLGVPGAVLADRLTGHLVREIIVRGSGGGPLTPLADQFNEPPALPWTVIPLVSLVPGGTRWVQRDGSSRSSTRRTRFSFTRIQA